MSPEQAEGKLEQLGPATDIYGLGATLYHILTGKPPCDSPDVNVVLQRVRDGEIAPPRALNSSVPRALDAICQKAMARLPCNRYASARDLAVDIEHWLADEPVAALPEPWGARTYRWVRRHRTLVTSGVATTAAVAALLTLTTILLHNKSRQLALTNSVLVSTNADLVLANKQTQEALYISQIRLAQRAWENGEIKKLRDLLDGCGLEFRDFEWHYLRNLSQSFARIGHDQAVRTVAYSPDGFLLASGSDDNKAILWDVRTGSVVHTLTAHTDRVNTVAFSPDGKLLATGSTDKMICIWDVVSLREGKKPSPLRTFQGHGKRVSGLAFSPDGSRLASASWDCTVRIWDTMTAQELRRIDIKESDRLWGLAMGPDGKVLAVCAGKRISLIDASNGKRLGTLSGHIDKVNSVAFSPDGKRLASGSDDRTAILWDVPKLELEQVLKGRHDGPITSLAFSPDGDHLATASWDKTVCIWPVHDMHEPKLLRGHTDRVYGVAYSPLGNGLASASGDWTVRLWQPPGDEPTLCLGVYTDTSRRIAFTNVPGQLPEVPKKANDVRVQTGRPEAIQASGSMTTGMAISRDGRLLATASSDQLIRLWDRNSRQFIRELKGHTDRVSGICFTPDDKQLLSSSWDGTVRLWNVDSGLEESQGDHHRRINAVACSPDGKLVATASADGAVYLWPITDLTHPSVRGQHGNEKSDLNDIAFSPDGKWLASASTDNSVALWDVHGPAAPRLLTGHDKTVFRIAFSPDGKQLASASSDHTIKLWNVESGAEIGQFRGCEDTVLGIAFHPHGKRLASASWDGAVKLWDVELRQETVSTKFDQCPTRVAFSPDGTQLVIGSLNGAVFFWDGKPTEEASAAKN
jgi:WD40 repeat protein